MIPPNMFKMILDVEHEERQREAERFMRNMKARKSGRTNHCQPQIAGSGFFTRISRVFRRREESGIWCCE